MPYSITNKTNGIALLFSLLYLIFAVLLNLLLPNIFITYPLLGIAIIVALVQLKKQKF